MTPETVSSAEELSCSVVEGQMELFPRRLFDNISSLVALQGLNYLMPLTTLPYLVRILGVGPFGLISVAQAFANYFVVFTDYGFNLSATRMVAREHDNPIEVSRIFSAVMTIKFIFMLIGAGITTLILALAPHFRHDANLYAVTYLSVIGSVLLPTWLFQGLQHMRTIAIVNGITKVAAACCLFVFVHSPRDYVIAAALPAIGILVSGIAGLWISLHHWKLRYRFPSLRILWEQVEDGFHLFISTASITLYSNTNVFLVGLLAGNVQAGYFSTGEKVVRASQGLLGPIFQAVFPHVNALARQSKEHAIVFLRRSLLWIGSVSLAPSLLLLFFAHPIVLLVFGDKAFGSIAVLRWIALLPLIIAISNILGVQTMVTFGMEKQFSRILISAGVANVALCSWLVFHYGAAGAAASVFFIELGVAFAMAAFVRQLGLFGRSPHSALLPYGKARDRGAIGCEPAPELPMGGPESV